MTDAAAKDMMGFGRELKGGVPGMRAGKQSFIRAYILSDIVLILLVIATLTPFIYRSLSAANDRSRADLASGLSQVVDGLEETLANLESMLMSASNEELNAVGSISGNARGGDYYKMSQAGRYVWTIERAYPSIVDILIVYRQNNIVVRAGGCFDTDANLDAYYGRENLREELFQARFGSYFLAQRELRLGVQSAPESVFGYCLPTGVSARSNACVLISVRSALTDRLSALLRGTGFYLLTDAQGEQLASWGAAEDYEKAGERKYITASASCPNGTLRLLAGYPREMAYETVFDMYILLAAVLLGAIIVGLTISSINARRANGPMQKLNSQLVSALRKTDFSETEIASLQSELDGFRKQERDFLEQVEEYRGALYNSAVTMLFTSGYVSDEDQANILAQTGDLFEKYVVGCGTVVGADAAGEYRDEMRTLLLERQRKLLPKGALFCQIGRDTVAALMDAGDADSFLANAASQGVNWSLSDAAEGVQNVAYALEQARFRRFSGSPVTLAELQRLYQHLIVGEAERGKELARDMLSRAAAENAGFVCESMKTMLGLAASQTRYTVTPPPLVGAFHGAAREEAVCAYIDSLCLASKARKQSHNERRKQCILSYIDEHYSESDLYAGVIAQQAGISEKYLYNFIKEQTGFSVGEYLMNLRMNRACEILREEDTPVKQIYAFTGFNSENTFYKAFRRRYGMPPGQYRQNARAQQKA